MFYKILYISFTRTKIYLSPLLTYPNNLSTHTSTHKRDQIESRIPTAAFPTPHATLSSQLSVLAVNARTYQTPACRYANVDLGACVGGMEEEEGDESRADGAGSSRANNGSSNSGSGRSRGNNRSNSNTAHSASANNANNAFNTYQPNQHPSSTSVSLSALPCWVAVAAAAAAILVCALSGAVAVLLLTGPVNSFSPHTTHPHAAGSGAGSAGGRVVKAPLFYDPIASTPSFVKPSSHAKTPVHTNMHTSKVKKAAPVLTHTRAHAHAANSHSNNKGAASKISTTTSTSTSSSYSSMSSVTGAFSAFSNFGSTSTSGSGSGSGGSGGTNRSSSKGQELRLPHRGLRRAWHHLQSMLLRCLSFIPLPFLSHAR